MSVMILALLNSFKNMHYMIFGVKWGKIPNFVFLPTGYSRSKTHETFGKTIANFHFKQILYYNPR